MRKTYLAISALLALSAAPALADTYEVNITYPDVDSRIIENHALNSMTQLKLSEAAETKARTKVVRDLASRIKTENACTAPLSAAACEKGMALPAALDADRQDMVNKLSHAPKFSYDEGYLFDITKCQSEQKASLENILEMESALPGSMSPGLVNYANQRLPRLYEDMSLANYASYKTQTKRGSLTQDDFMRPGRQLASAPVNFD